MGETLALDAVSYPSVVRQRYKGQNVGTLRPITEFMNRPDDEEAKFILASEYKLKRWIQDSVNDGTSTTTVLEQVRFILGQARFQQDGISYQQMREFINQFDEYWGL